MGNAALRQDIVEKVSCIISGLTFSHQRAILTASRQRHSIFWSS